MPRDREWTAWVPLPPNYSDWDDEADEDDEDEDEDEVAPIEKPLNIMRHLANGDAV